MKEAFVDFMKRELQPETVLIACGLPASYKTETTEVIAKLKGYKILRTDLIRLEVLKNEDIFEEKVASDMKKRELVYDEMFSCADELAGKGEGIILDATFITQALRRRAAEIAARHEKVFVIQQTQCPQEVSLRRISERTKEDYESNAPTWPSKVRVTSSLFSPILISITDLSGKIIGLCVNVNGHIGVTINDSKSG